MARTMSDEEKKAFGERMKAIREKKKAEKEADQVFNEPQATPEPVIEAPDPSEITLRFRQPVEVYINGIAYTGSVIKVKDMEIATEIVRIAKEAYGWSVIV